jgi:diaminopimelate epimerase
MTSPPTFSKWHAHGNSYLVTPPLADPAPAAVRELVGAADGLVEITPLAADEAEVVIWNADGSRAEMSGNGTRIAARWLAEQTGAELVRVHVGSRTVVARMLRDGQVETDMGEVEVARPERIEGLKVVAVSVGNPHAVVRGDPAEISHIGPLLETHPHFPNRTNVQVARLEGTRVIAARVWERGVGETASSGTSAVAVAAAFGENPATVLFPGGALGVRFEGRRAFLTGPAERLE